MTKSTDDLAKEIRAHIRDIAKLPCAWDQASDNMREWYRMLAERNSYLPKSR